MQQSISSPEQLDPRTRQFYLDSMKILDEAGVGYLVGGAYCLAHYAGIVRHTKDFDVFVRKADSQRALQAFERAGYRTELVFPHWLGKAFRPKSEDFVDVIFSSGNGLCDVTDEWFEHAVDGVALDKPARLIPPEEVIRTKAFVQERERFDGADIAHVLYQQGPTLDWPRLIRNFQGHSQVLLAHLILFTYIYPREKDRVPGEVMDELYRRVRAEPPAADKILRGTFISREQYLMDLQDRDYADARLEQHGGPMKAEDVAHWTAAIGTIK
ncbi:MAG TPA: hypothetical protein VER17_10680 [Tepidisphaeraceae bacterium]|nr:hypothetical protein [Tepidisphaeraceae bacterium]